MAAHASDPRAGLAAEFVAWATRGRSAPSPDTPLLQTIADRCGRSVASIIKEAIAAVPAPDRRDALAIYFEELFGHDRRTITARRSDAAARIGYTEAALRYRPGGDATKSHEYRLLSELAEFVEAGEAAEDVVAASDRSASDPDPEPAAEPAADPDPDPDPEPAAEPAADPDPDPEPTTDPEPAADPDPEKGQPRGAPSTRQRTTFRRVVVVGIALCVLGATLAAGLAFRRSSATALPGRALTGSERRVDGGCREGDGDLDLPDQELATIARSIRAWVAQQGRAAGVACRTGVPEWIGLTEDPRVRARPGSARVAVERYRDRWGFNGAVFATQSDSPTFVPGPTFDAWLSLNRLFPLGFPSEMTIHDDGSVWSKLSTDYPLTEGWLVAQRPDVPAYFLSSWIEAAVPFEVRGYPLGNLGGPIVPGATIQDFEGGRFALVGVDAEARPTVSFSPWPAEAAPSIEPRSLVKDPTGATQWWVDESGGRWWVPTGDVRDCLLTGPNALVEEPVTAVELAPLAVRGAVDCANPSARADCSVMIAGDEGVPASVVERFRATYRRERLQQFGCPKGHVHGWSDAAWSLDLWSIASGWSAVMMPTGGTTPVHISGAVLQRIERSTTGLTGSIGAPASPPRMCGTRAVFSLAGGMSGDGWIEMNQDRTFTTHFDGSSPSCRAG